MAEIFGILRSSFYLALPPKNFSAISAIPALGKYIAISPPPPDKPIEYVVRKLRNRE